MLKIVAVIGSTKILRDNCVNFSHSCTLRPRIMLYSYSKEHYYIFFLLLFLIQEALLEISIYVCIVKSVMFSMILLYKISQTQDMYIYIYIVWIYCLEWKEKYSAIKKGFTLQLISLLYSSLYVWFLLQYPYALFVPRPSTEDLCDIHISQFKSVLC